MVDLDLYKLFYTVAKNGSLTKAAQELHISQPAVSQAIKQLENKLGGKLFNRVSRGMELTETGGRQVFAAVDQAMKLIGAAEAKFKEMKTVATGTVRISATDTMNCTGLKPAKTVSTPLSTPKRRAFNIIWTR